MGVAVSFTSEEKAAIFTIKGHMMIQISAWSRFARERESLYPPSSKFEITHALTQEEAEITGTTAQVFEMYSISELRVLLIFVRRIIAQCVSRGGRELNKEAAQLFSISSALQRAEDTESAGPKTEALELLCDSAQPALLLPGGQALAAAGKLVNLGADRGVVRRAWDDAVARARRDAAALLYPLTGVGAADASQLLLFAAERGDAASAATLHAVLSGAASDKAKGDGGDGAGPGAVPPSPKLRAAASRGGWFIESVLFADPGAAPDATIRRALHGVRRPRWDVLGPQSRQVAPAPEEGNLSKVTRAEEAAAAGDCGAAVVLIDQCGKEDLRQTVVLHYAARWRGMVPGSFELEALGRIARKTGCDIRSRHGATPLHAAADAGQIDAIRCLLCEGADPLIKDGDGDAPAECALLRGHYAIAAELKQAAPLLRSPGAAAHSIPGERTAT
eukprot:gene4481-14093_t